MAKEHIGYLDFDGRIVHFLRARCCFDRGQLDVEAEGPKCRLHLYGARFPEAESVADLPGMVFAPDAQMVRDDPIAEGGIETKAMWLSFRSLEVRCRAHDPQARLITVAFQGEVADRESGRSGTIDGAVRCSVVDELW